MGSLITQFGSVNWVVSLVSGFLLSIVGSLITHAIQNWIARLSAGRAKRRIHVIEEERRSLEKLAQSPFDFGVTLAASGIKVLICFALASAITTLSDIFPAQMMSDVTYGSLSAIGSLLYLVSMLLGVDMLRTVTRVRNLPAYEERVERAIAGLKERGAR